MRVAGAGWCCAIAIAASGCGDSKPAAPTFSHWSARADAACREATAAIAERGWARDLNQLSSLASAASKEVATAAGDIGRLPRPATRTQDVDAVNARLRDLRAVVDRVAQQSDATALEELQARAEALKARLFQLERAAHDAGMRHCLVEDEHAWVPDAIRAPVFAERLVRMDRRYGGRLIALAHRPMTTLDDVRRYSERAARLVEDFITAMNDLKPPWWVDEQVWNYRTKLRDFQSLLSEIAGEVSLPSPSLAKLERLQRKNAEVSAAERRAWRKLVRRIGAVPLGRPDASKLGGDEQTT